MNIILVILTSPKHMDIKLFMERKHAQLVYQAFLDNIYCISCKLSLGNNIKPMFQIVGTHDYLANK
jgi:hypothetical protein